MSYDDVEIEDMQWSDELQAYTYPCPCGDLFQITKEELKLGEEIARCPSCSLYITVIYNAEDFADDKSKNNLEPEKRQAVAIFILAVGKEHNYTIVKDVSLEINTLRDVHCSASIDEGILSL
ncbi:hypothetical protein SCA6_005888 [Theobroma cacao]